MCGGGGGGGGDNIQLIIEKTLATYVSRVANIMARGVRECPPPLIETLSLFTVLYYCTIKRKVMGLFSIQAGCCIMHVCVYL